MDSIFEKVYDEVVSLGTCCEVSFALNEVYGKKYPFDWLRIYDYEEIFRLIEGRFQNFPEFENRFNPNTGINQYMCKFYNISTHYRGPTNMTSEEETYRRRAERFLEIIREGTSKILFFLKGHIKDGLISEDLSARIRDGIRKINPELDFSLVVVNEYDKEKNETPEEYARENILFIPCAETVVVMENSPVVHHCNTARMIERPFWKKLLGRFRLDCEQSGR